MSEALPRVCVVTDGSGRAGHPRTDYSAGLLARLGATPGTIFGRYADTAIYRALLDHRHELLLDLARELADAIAADPPPYVVHDALEGYNPVHDLCRWLAGAALAIAGRPDTPQFEVSTTGRALAADMRVELDDDLAARKLAAAHRFEPLGDEVREKLERFGPDFLRTETFARVPRWDETDLFTDPPEYERFAAERVAAGIYSEMIRFRENLLPVLDALRAEVGAAALAVTR